MLSPFFVSHAIPEISKTLLYLKRGGFLNQESQL